MRNVYIIGSDTLKFDRYKGISHIELTRRTVESCLADAQLTKKIFSTSGLATVFGAIRTASTAFAANLP